MPEHTPAPTPARSLYGFFMYLFSKTALGIYCIWAFVPDNYLHCFNIYYYPQKYWATAVPIQCLVALTLFAFIIYPMSNLMLTPKIDSIATISDPNSSYTPSKKKLVTVIPSRCICTDITKCHKSKFKIEPADIDENTVPELLDLNISLVCKNLYFNK